MAPTLHLVPNYITSALFAGRDKLALVCKVPYAVSHMPAFCMHRYRTSYM